MPSSCLILCCRLLLLPSNILSIRVFSNESVLHIGWPKCWSFSFSISPSNEYSGLISFRMDWLDLLAVQGTLKSLLQLHSSKASILRCSAFFIVSHPQMTNIYSNPLPILSWVFNLFFIIELCCLYSLYASLKIRHVICRYFIPFWGLSFHSLHIILWPTKVFSFDKVLFISLLLLVLSIPYKKLLPKPESWRFIPMFPSKSFIDFILKFKSLKTKGLIFIYGMR